MGTGAFDLNGAFVDDVDRESGRWRRSVGGVVRSSAIVGQGDDTIGLKRNRVSNIVAGALDGDAVPLVP